MNFSQIWYSSVSPKSSKVTWAFFAPPFVVNTAFCSIVKRPPVLSSLLTPARPMVVHSWCGDQNLIHLSLLNTYKSITFGLSLKYAEFQAWLKRGNARQARPRVAKAFTWKGPSPHTRPFLQAHSLDDVRLLCSYWICSKAMVYIPKGATQATGPLPPSLLALKFSIYRHNRMKF